MLRGNSFLPWRSAVDGAQLAVRRTKSKNNGTIEEEESNSNEKAPLRGSRKSGNFRFLFPDIPYKQEV